MSTKMTLWHNDDFHLYAEGLDDENVYLDIRTPYTEQFVLKIPLSAWKEMRRHTIEPAERYSDMSDDELLMEAERAVDEHRARLHEIRQQGGRNIELRLMLGSFIFGPPESTPEEMIKSFLSVYRPALVEKHETAGG